MLTSTLQQDVYSSEQQYRVELIPLAPAAEIPQEQKDALIRRARQGDQQARRSIILQLLPQVERFARRYFQAYHWASHRIEYLDLVQAGNEALLSSLQQALHKVNPYAYLTIAAYGAIRLYSRRNPSAIATPLTTGTVPLQVCSLDAPLSEEGGTLLDLISEICQEEPLVSGDSELPDHSVLYEAIEALRARERLVVIHHYGLHQQAPESLAQIERTFGWVQGTARHVKQRALTKLSLLLAQRLPNDQLTPALPQKRSPTSMQPLPLTAEQEQRLAQAQARLQARGEKVTSQTLRKEARMGAQFVNPYCQRLRAGQKRPEQRLEEAYAALEARGEKMTSQALKTLAQVTTSEASAYLHRRQGTRPRQLSERCAQERIEEAYATLQARGEKITVQILARKAGASSTVAQAYLQEVRGPKRSIQERIEEAYATLQARGEKITVQTLARACHVGEHTVSAYLRQRREQPHDVVYAP